MKSILLAPMVGVAMLALGTTARAQPPSGLELSAGASLTGRYTTRADLAALAGSSGYGSGNDLGPSTLGLELHGGVNLPLAELGVGGWLAVGGLSLDSVERRYLGGTPAQLGSSLDLGAEAALRLHPDISRELGLKVGPAIAWQGMAASSPLGMARLELLGVGLDAGLVLRTGAISRVVDGHVELMLSARRELPLDVYVARDANDVLLSGTAGSAGAIYSFGARLGYVFDFHRAR